MKLGLNLWTVCGWNLDGRVSTDLLSSVADLGAQGFELILDEGGNSAEQLLAAKEELLATLEDVGLQVPSIATTLFWKYNLACQDEGERRRAKQIIYEGCRVARAFSAGVFLVVAGQQEPRTEYDRTYEAAVRSLRQAAEQVEDLEVVIGVENVRTSFLCSPGEYAQFIADVDHPLVQAYLDFGNGMSVGPSYPENWVTAVEGRIAMVHAKDYDRHSGEYVCCGLGDLSWEDTFAALKTIGYDDYLIVETPPAGGRGQPDIDAGLHAAKTSLSWLSRFV